MKKIFKLNSKYYIILAIILPFILFGIFVLTCYDAEKENNYQNIFSKINQDSLVQKYIGGINMYGHLVTVLCKEKSDRYEYVRMKVPAKNQRQAIVEYYIDKSESVWILDSVIIVKIW